MSEGNELVPIEQEQQGDSDTLFVIQGMRFTRQGAHIEAGLPFDMWASGVYSIDTVQKGAPWWIGDMLLYGEGEYGEMYSQVMEHTNMSYSTLTTYKSVAKAFPPSERRAGVDWSKHEACAALMRIDSEAAGNILDAVQREGMKLSEVKWHAREQIAMLDGEDADNGWHDPPISTPIEDIKKVVAMARSIGTPISEWHKQSRVIQPDASWFDDLLEIVVLLARAKGTFRIEQVQERAQQWVADHGFSLDEELP